MASAAHVTPELFRFLRELARNNAKPWFEGNRARYEEHIKAPMQRFVVEAQSAFLRFAPQFEGSLLRIHRDVRFSKDKSPYKTNVGLHFRHRGGKDIHTPGFYLHLAPDEVFIVAGLWHPDPATLGRDIALHQALEPGTGPSVPMDLYRQGASCVAAAHCVHGL